MANGGVRKVPNLFDLGGNMDTFLDFHCISNASQSCIHNRFTGSGTTVGICMVKNWCTAKKRNPPKPSCNLTYIYMYTIIYIYYNYIYI